eukprot:jgi/Hompol1/91/HPOL_005221-RA
MGPFRQGNHMFRKFLSHWIVRPNEQPSDVLAADTQTNVIHNVDSIDEDVKLETIDEPLPTDEKVPASKPKIRLVSGHSSPFHRSDLFESTLGDYMPGLFEMRPNRKNETIDVAAATEELKYSDERDLAQFELFEELDITPKSKQILPPELLLGIGILVQEVVRQKFPAAKAPSWHDVLQDAELYYEQEGVDLY